MGSEIGGNGGVPDAEAGDVEGGCGDGGAGDGAAEVGLLHPAAGGAWGSLDGMGGRGWGWGDTYYRSRIPGWCCRAAGRRHAAAAMIPWRGMWLRSWSRVPRRNFWHRGRRCTSRGWRSRPSRSGRCPWRGCKRGSNLG